MNKPALLLVAIAIVHMLDLVAIPITAFILTMAVYASWMVFVSWNAWSAFRRMDRRRLALLEASGVECNLASLMSDRRAWAAAKEGKTMRQILDGPLLH